MPNQKLFDEESDTDEVVLKTENEYAKNYDKWREKEELHKLEQKYGDKALNSDASVSTDSEDESDEPLEISEETETQFLKTLALLKTKDPRIYDPQFKCFDVNKVEEKQENPKEKTFTFEDSDDEDDDSDGNIFKVEKRAPEIQKDEKCERPGPSINKPSKEGKIKDFLTGKVEDIDNDTANDLAPLRALWSDPKISDGEAFLRDYILNQRYLEDGDAGDLADKVRDDADLEADEEMVEEQGKFERAYNFRFEEPDDEYLKRFPRTMNYIRPKDDRRSRKRAEVRARKEEEKKKKMEEIARLKAFKLKEIQEKIAKIKEVTGNQDLAFKDEDIEGDFDPEEHDRRMKALFDEEYYGDADQEKPVFPDLDEELEIENWEKYEVEPVPENYEEQNDDELHCEDQDFNMDADYDPKKARADLLEEIKGNLNKKRRNRKKKSKLAELLATEKPKYVPTVAEKTYAEYMEDYYKMDCEDIIGGDLPTRFKYREVVPNDFGLSVEEILLADDKELTQWVPLKKILRHRPENVEKGDVKSYRQRAADEKLKKKILPSLFKDLPEEPEVVVPVENASKKKKKKKKNKEKNQGDSEETAVNGEDKIENTIEVNVEIKKKKKSKHKDSSQIEDVSISKEDVSNKLHEDPSSNKESEFVEDTKKKKKKKERDNGFIIESSLNEAPSQTSIDQTNAASSKELGVSLKRKLDNGLSQFPSKKKKKKNKEKADPQTHDKKNSKEFNKKKHKNKLHNTQDKTSDNPLCKLSDERLIAYGLNPKKYRSFLKYKKF